MPPTRGNAALMVASRRGRFFPQRYVSWCCRNAPRGGTALMVRSGQGRFFPQRYVSVAGMPHAALPPSWQQVGVATRGS
jgi:hypothetical protein